jgi:hypothetical protein
MAEAANDVIAASEVPEKEVKTATDIDSTTAEAKVVEEVKQDAVTEAATNGDAATTNDEETKTEEKSDDVTAVDTKDEKNGDATNDLTEDKREEKGDADGEKQDSEAKTGDKRKEPPVSISAHDRYDNKRPRAGYGKHSRVQTRFEVRTDPRCTQIEPHFTPS